MSITNLIDEIEIRKVFTIIKSINHPIRIAILELLNVHNTLNVTEIYSKLRIEQPIVSQHLNILKKANLIINSKKGKTINYKLNNEELDKILIYCKQIAVN